jgi:hypothetical protein
MAPDQFGNRGDQLLAESGAGFRRPEPNLGIDGKGGEPFSRFGRAAQQCAPLAHDARSERDEVARG